MYEASKAVMRRMHDSRFATRYFAGDGIDIGAGPDALGACRELAPSKQESTTYEPSLVCKLLIFCCRPLIPDRLLVQYEEQFPLMRSCRLWDIEDGDAQLLASVADSALDFVHSSHCLEHMRHPREALHHWLRVLKPAGHAVITVPDEDLYEQGAFPSTFNTDHKWTFTMHKATSWSAKSVNLMDILTQFSDIAQVVKIEQLDATFRFGLPRIDQTLTPVAECALEFILRKRPANEIARKGRYPDVSA